jgi:hypothetical protein
MENLKMEIAIPNLISVIIRGIHRCGQDIPIVGKLSRPHNDRVVILQRRIRWMENYYHDANINNLKALKQELAELLEEDAKADKLRSLSMFVQLQNYWLEIRMFSVMIRSIYMHVIAKKSEIQKVYEIDHLSKVT